MTSQPIKSPPEKGAKSPEEENKCVCVSVCVSCVYQVSNCSVWMKADCEPVGPYLLDSLDHRLQPIGVDLAVAVQEGQDGGRGRVGSTHTWSDQTWREQDEEEKRHWSQSNRSSMSSIFQVDAASLHVGIFLILSVGKVTADTKLKHIVGSLLKHSTDLTRRSRCICHTRSSRPVNRSITSPALAKHPWTVDRSFQKVSCDTSSDFFTGSLCKNHNSFLKILLKLRDNVCYLFFLLWSTLRRGICSNNWLHFGSGF